MERIILMRNDTQGEGSRGGKVIGHTSSGKPIYSSPEHSGHQHFNEKEHRESARLHLKYSNESRGHYHEGHRKAHDQHISMADQAKTQAKKNKEVGSPPIRLK